MTGLSVVCLSGGMDSTVAAAIVREHGDVALLHADYGQRTARREQAAFDAIARHWAIPDSRRLVVEFSFLRQIGGSSLTDPAIPVRHGTPEPGQIPSSYVPFRNAHLLAAATSWAEVLGARTIVIGAVEADSSGYPDCRPEFYRAFQEAIRLGTKTSAVAIATPVIGLTKAEIVARGRALQAPLHLTWSCYEFEDEACGECESCVLRLRGFAAAGAIDEIPYRTKSRP